MYIWVYMVQGLKTMRLRAVQDVKGFFILPLFSQE